MNYELAKELKDAGLPQTGRGTWIDDKEPKELPSMPHWEGAVYVPTLTELIEACGKPFQLIVMENGGATAMHLVGPGIASSSGSAEEAVARLWLALNKQP